MLGVFLGASALAQAASPNGIKVGEGRLHPFFDLELHYDSAAGYASTTPSSSALRPDLVARFRPGLRLEVPSDLVALNLIGSAEYVWYTGLITRGMTPASRLEGNASLEMSVNRAGFIGFDVGDTFSRSDRTSAVGASLGILSLYNELRAGLPVRPGGGALEITPRAAWGIEVFQSMFTGADVSGWNYNNLRFELDGRMRFLPKTALIANVSYAMRSYADTTNGTPQLLRGTVGLSGLVTPKITALVKAGWAHNFGGVGSTFIGQLEGGYLISETATFRIGYLRALEPVPTYVVFADDRGYLDLKLQVMGRLNVHAYAAVDYLSFYGAGGRNDFVIVGDLGPDFQVTSWFIVGVAYVPNIRISSNAQFNVPRQEAFLRLTVTY